MSHPKLTPPARNGLIVLCGFGLVLVAMIVLTSL